MELIILRRLCGVEKLKSNIILLVMGKGKVGHMSKDRCRLITLKFSCLLQVEGAGAVLGLPLGLSRFRGRRGGGHVGVFSVLLVIAETPRR